MENESKNLASYLYSDDQAISSKNTESNHSENFFIKKEDNSSTAVRSEST